MNLILTVLPNTCAFCMRSIAFQPKYFKSVTYCVSLEGCCLCKHKKEMYSKNYLDIAVAIEDRSHEVLTCWNHLLYLIQNRWSDALETGTSYFFSLSINIFHQIFPFNSFPKLRAQLVIFRSDLSLSSNKWQSGRSVRLHIAKEESRKDFYGRHHDENSHLRPSVLQLILGTG